MKQIYKDLCSGSSEKYWKNEGNNKRMQNYNKLSKSLKIVKQIIKLLIIIYFIILSTNSIFCLYDRLICCNNEVNLLSFVDFRKFLLDTYIATFIIFVFVVLYISRKKKDSLNNIINIFMISLLFLPVSILVVYNFVVLGSLMRSFYLLVVFSVVIFIINQLTNRIDKLYNLAVGNMEMNRKGDKKVCKEK